MATRFRKTIKIAPGVRLNVGMNGLSMNVGPRGASVSFTRRGTYANLGVPGTGLSSRKLLSAPSGTARRGAKAAAVQAVPKAIDVQLMFTEDGQIRYLDANGDPLSEATVKVLRQQNKAAIVAGLQAACDRVNGEMEAVSSLHTDTPAPLVRRQHVVVPFGDDEPVLRLAPLTLLQRLLPPLKSRALASHQAARERHRRAVEQWSAEKAQHDTLQAAEVARVEQLHHDTALMEQELEAAFEDLEWPRETSVGYELAQGGTAVLLDVDLPEFEDMPRQVASVPARADRLVVKTLADARARELYARHIHAVLFRLVGVVFNRLPSVVLVVVSGYSQRANGATGHMQDDYLVSARIDRATWSGLNFNELTLLDPMLAMERFELRRDMSKSHMLRTIEPFAL